VPRSHHEIHLSHPEVVILDVVDDVDLLWACGRPRIGPDRRLGSFCPGSGAQSRLGYNCPNGVDDNIWLFEMHVMIRIGSHHLSALTRERGTSV
jgi:hypothetical protein